MRALLTVAIVWFVLVRGVVSRGLCLGFRNAYVKKQPLPELVFLSGRHSGVASNSRAAQFI